MNRITSDLSIGERADLQVRAEVAEREWRSAIARLDAATRVIARLTAERGHAISLSEARYNRARRFGWCGVAVASVMFVVAVVGWAKWWLR
jgi:hypothetical protein